MARRREQSKEAFIALHDRMGKRLLAYLVRRMHDSDAAAELWAECWAIAFENWRRCRAATDAEAEGWVFGIARNQLGTYYRMPCDCGSSTASRTRGGAAAWLL